MVKSTLSLVSVAAVLSVGTAFQPLAGVSTQRQTMDFCRTQPLYMSDDWDAPSKSAMIGGAGINNAGEPPFEIRGFSLGNLVIGAGLLTTFASFAEYLGDNSETLGVSGLGFVYGIPIFLAGAALKYAEIEPVPCFSTKAGEAIFESKATETIRKIKQDVTRHRYGDEAHLDTTVKKLGLVVPGKAYPQLQELREEEIDGELAFTMVWQSLDTPYKMWADERRVKKYETFFGPNINADVVKLDAEQRLVGIRLTTGERKVETPEETAKETTEA
ncbi:Thylakoid membrane protein [Seminavis robusta]|uniref:Thylakoid membrane protein n=1 Tax=Seminavis robusta TaxID=568900 RepID=A0A9N8EGL6_9STRA|nr:Thylakoid membrane protein [Seminavis robusta]|eukprot:Sro1168_g248560.1 Thylakoid membrane protein (273) ;mRNA; f:32277-33192